ncbi:MAG: hypothetical protein A6F70_07765 [Cycloclasticus sp. symbiont of Bathymodiolus heckerae]|nr:MAG: hypothetical protein A6F70_07765 [Cycloclasticus sp. symbiont of Bathymodiolus heckerae]
MKLPGVKAAYWLQLLSYLSLIGFMTAWITVLAPPQTFPIGLVLIACIVPLLLPLMGVLHGRDKPINWAAYMSLLYFIHGTVEAFASPETRILGIIEIIISLTVFFSASLYIRHVSKH